MLFAAGFNKYGKSIFGVWDLELMELKLKERKNHPISDIETIPGNGERDPLVIICLTQHNCCKLLEI